MLRNVFVARVAGRDDPVTQRGGLRAFTLALLVAAAATTAIGCSSVVASAAVRATAATRVCAELGATKAVVTQVFGAGAKATIYKATTTTYCGIIPPGVTRACQGTDCTDVFIFTTGLDADVAYQVAELKRYGNGRVSEVPVAGAGSGAVLVKDTNYGNSGYGLGPVLFFTGGADTIAIQGSLTGPPPLKKWEALARAIHAHMG
jgi:hypothetical protein